MSKGVPQEVIDESKKKCSEIRSGRVPVYEPDLEKTLKIGLRKSLKISDDFSLIIDSDMIFVTVGTPQKANGEIDLSMIKNATRSIGKVIRKTNKNQIILIKSTVIPGTTEKIIIPILEKESGKKANKEFGVISNPEFLQESNAIRDTKYPHAIILGGENTSHMKKVKLFFS